MTHRPGRPFSSDEYIRRRLPLDSCACPLVKQTRLIGVLYLENNLTLGRVHARP